MILHDWQRGKIPFFVPPPKEEDAVVDELEGTDRDETPLDEEKAAARRKIDDVVSSQKIDEFPVQKDLFSEQELIGDAINP